MTLQEQASKFVDEWYKFLNCLFKELKLQKLMKALSSKFEE
jgi:hypothetical protein